MKFDRLAALCVGMCLASTSVMAATMPTTEASSSVTTTASKAEAAMSNADKVAYALGMSMGKGLKQQGVELNTTMFNQGLTDALQGKKTALNSKEMNDTLMAFQKDLFAKQQAKMKALADKNLQAGEKYLTSNKAQAGVKTTESGLQYKVLTAGTGAKPTADDTVTVDYEGRLIDGTVFDSSYKKGKPATFAVKQVIKGWQEVLPMMPVGSTWEVTIPAKLAYGAMGAGGLIGPNETLVFKIHLISIAKAQTNTTSTSTKTAS